MKFCKKYEEYMQGQKEKKNLPGVGFKKLKKILKRCRRNHVPSRISFTDAINHNCSRECPGTVMGLFSRSFSRKWKMLLDGLTSMLRSFLSFI